MRVVRARRLTASKTLMVPSTFTRAPSGGSARQNGTWSAARWMTWSMPRSSITAERPSRSVMSPATMSTLASSSAVMIWRSRRGSPPRSNVVTGTPSRTSARTVHAPMHPSAPVTRNRSSLTRPPPRGRTGTC